MEKIKTQKAIGKILGADVTEVVPDVKKGPLFKKGHIIRKDDIVPLLSIGKHYVWIFSEREGFIHEDDAATEMMNLVKKENLRLSSPSESKVKLFAEVKGVLIINMKGLEEINRLKNPRVATKRNFSFVEKNTPVAIGKVMPLEIPVTEMDEIRSITEEYYPIIDLLSIKNHRIALFPVGNEFIERRREETMSGRVKQYLEQLGQDIVLEKVLPDDVSQIRESGMDAVEKGLDIIIYMGGMAVDPDDKTVEGIEKMGAEIVMYGVPMWPGTTFLLAYKDGKIILGIPSSAGFMEKGTSFHKIMPIILSNYIISRDTLIKMGEGGFIDARNL